MSDKIKSRIQMQVEAEMKFQADKREGQSELSPARGSALRGYKEDHRPPRHGWADGHYMNKCHWCSENFVVDKRAVQCADCAYKDVAPNEKVQI